jgi:uncharacterized protein (TIRG00374 family)
LFLIYFIEADKILEVLKNANPVFLLAALVLLTLNIFLQFRKWKLLCNNILSVYDKKKILKSLLIGIGAGMFTPMKSGEYFARSLELNDSSAVSVTLATVVDKSFTFITIFLIGGITFIFSLEKFISGSTVLFYLSLLTYVIVAVFITVVIGYRKRVKFNFNNKNKYKIVDNFNEFISSIKTLPSNIILKTFIFAAFHLVTICIQFLFLLIAFNGELNQYFFQIPVLMFFIQIFIPPLVLGEIGIRETASVFLVGKIGISPAVGFNAAMFLFLINFIVPSILTLFFILRKK